MMKLYRDQSGVASLLTVIFLAIILTIITTGLLRLAIQDARQSTDDDLTNRAFYAAESGVNDAVRFINKKLADPSYDLNGDDCSPPPSENDVNILAGEDAGTSYTCQLIDLSPSQISYFVDEDETSQVDLKTDNPTPTADLKIRWHLIGDEPGSLAFRNNNQLPPKDSWATGGNQTPALLRVNLFSTPNNDQGPFNRGQIGNYVLFLNSNSAGNGNAPSQSFNVTAEDGEIIRGQNRCTTDVQIREGYACEATITLPNFDTRIYSIRMTPLYTSSDVNLSFADDPNRSFIETQALVDVTGKASDVFRRVQASVSLENSTARLLPNYALQTAGDICKLITVSDTVVDGCVTP